MRIPATLLVLLAFAGPAPASETIPSEKTELLLGADYPIEVSVAFHEGLLHWLDSLTMAAGIGLTAGKSAPAHHAEYLRLLGSLGPSDQKLLSQYRRVRRAWVLSAARADADALTRAFFEANDLDDALARAERLLGEAESQQLTESIRHFEKGYRKIWREGKIARDWVESVRRSERRAELTGFLVDLARWFDVSPTAKPAPRLVLTPVPPGYGTHAQAIGRYLLIEIRPREGLADEAAPIVHENAHLLMNRIPAERMALLEAAVTSVRPHGDEAWRTLQEALPTSIAQGIADSRFRSGSWSLRQPWYHTRPVDRYAKRIYALVKQSLADGGRLDADLARELAKAFQPSP